MDKIQFYESDVLIYEHVVIGDEFSRFPLTHFILKIGCEYKFKINGETECVFIPKQLVFASIYTNRVTIETSLYD